MSGAFLELEAKHAGWRFWVVWVLATNLAGALVGVPQQVVLARFDARLARGWVVISAVAWGVFFPGAVSGLFLAYRLHRQVRPGS